MKTKQDTRAIENQLACPILFMPVFKTPEGKYFIDDNQIYRKPSHSVIARKFDTYHCMAEMTTTPTLLNTTLISNAVSCSNFECCGCLIEESQIGNIKCNECGQEYKMVKC